jgi:ABC-type amino acid transport substrate-binding protein
MRAHDERFRGGEGSMHRRLGGAVALGAVLVLVLAACANNEPSGGSSGGSGGASPTAAQLNTLTPGTLLVGSCLDYKPFEYYQGGTLTGFDVEIMDALTQKMGLKLEWKKSNFDTIFTALAAHSFDAVAAASTIKPDRLQIVDFSNPYYNARQSLTVNTTKTPDVTTTDQLPSNAVIGVQKGTTGKDWATENLAPKGMQIKTYTNAPDAFTDLEAGNITGVINDEPSSEAEVESRPDLKVVEPIDTGEHYGIAVAKDRPDILAGINDALAAIIADGTYAQIFSKYFPGVPVPPEFGG